MVFGSLSLGGCAADYLNHYDTVSLAAGDAQNANRLLHTTNPLNPVSHNTAIETDGQRSTASAARYQTSQQPGAAPQPNVTVNVGTGTN